MESLKEKWQTISQLNEIGISLSSEENVSHLLENILLSAKQITRAEGGTLYRVTPENTLSFELFYNDALHSFWEKKETPLPFPEIPLFLEKGALNEHSIVSYAVNHKKIMNITDAYREKAFDFSQTYQWDQKIGYKTHSVLTVPLYNHKKKVIAALQLINCRGKKGELKPFSQEEEQLAHSLASQAGIALSNRLLIQNLKNLFHASIQMVAEAIDAKSPMMGQHEKRVPILTQMLAEAINKTEQEPFRECSFSEEQLYALQVASLLHDWGKITTPVHLIEKRTKLEKIVDGMEMVDYRFELLYWQEKVRFLEQQSHNKQALEERLKTLAAECQFLKRCNESKIQISEENQKKIASIAQQKYFFKGKEHSLLSKEEVEALSLKEGNLTPSEKAVVQDHVSMTEKMLSFLPFPEELKEVPAIACSHHERPDGKGYPKGLHKEEIPLGGRLLAIVDVFEALSASDRPYKKTLKLSQVIGIMQKMVEENKLDGDIFHVFLHEKVYEDYAQKYLLPEQIDIDPTLRTKRSFTD